MDEVEHARALKKFTGARESEDIKGGSYFLKLVRGEGLIRCNWCGLLFAETNKHKHGLDRCKPGDWRHLHIPHYGKWPVCFICFELFPMKQSEEYIRHLHDDHAPGNLQAWGWNTFVLTSDEHGCYLAPRDKTPRQKKPPMLMLESPVKDESGASPTVISATGDPVFNAFHKLYLKASLTKSS